LITTKSKESHGAEAVELKLQRASSRMKSTSLTIEQLASSFTITFLEVSPDTRLFVKLGPGHSDSKEMRLYRAKDKLYEIGIKLGLA
jgi:hypothetical protein